MSGTREQTRLQDLLDGLLPENLAAEVHQELETDPDLNREFRWMQAVHSLLSEPLDVDPPANLESSILGALQARRLQPARWSLRLPRWAENSLVLAGATGLAMIIGVGRIAGADWAAPWVGRATVGVADAVSFAAQMVVGTRELDWALRLVSTFSQAGWTILGSSTDALLLVGVISTAMALLTAWGLTRGTRLLKGGTFHAHLLS
jgi:anti-sigma factor RsiW